MIVPSEPRTANENRTKRTKTHAVTRRCGLHYVPTLDATASGCVARFMRISIQRPPIENAPKLTRDAHVTPECHHLHLLLQSTPPVQRRARPAPQARVLASPPLSPRHTPQDYTRYATRHACGVFSPVPAAHVSRGHHVPRGGAHGLTRAVSRGFAPVPRASLLKRLRPCRAGRPS